MKNSSPVSAPALIGIFSAVLVALFWPEHDSQPDAIDNIKATTARQRLAALERAASHYPQRLKQPGVKLKPEQGSEVITNDPDQNIEDQYEEDTVLATDNTLTLEHDQTPLHPLGDHVIVNFALAHPRRLVARLSDNADFGQFKQVLGKSGAELLNNPLEQDGLAIIQAPEADSGIDPAVNLQIQRKALLESGLVAFTEPDYVVNVNAPPDDPGFNQGLLWGLRNTGQNGGTAGMDIDAEGAWDVTTGSSDVIVAVIDTGIRSTHYDLAVNMWVNAGEIADNGLDDDGDGYIDNIHGIDVANNDGDPDDDHSHGTHVAGTIGAAANDGNLCVGVAWNVRLMACKFLDERGYGYTSDAVKCIDFAVSKGARILNCSWGSSGSSEAIREALERAGENGVICVAAAGNSGVDTDQYPHYPSGYDLDNIISVAAIDRNGRLASWSNYGRTTVDVAAPGVEILSSVADSDSSYSYYSGTSMATPHVVGIAALMLANDPQLTAAQLKSGILNTSVLLDNLEGLCVTGGLANANNALQGGGDGELEVELTASETPLIGGQSVLFFARVTDVDPITDAVVSGTIMEASLSFSDDGTNGDVNAEDGIYTTAFMAPTDTSLTQLILTVTATAPGYSSTTASAEFTVLHSPSNDDFADSITISGSRARFTGSNLGATAEKGEPRHYFWKAQCSVWYEWTAPSTGLAMVTTRGSNFDTVMAVYTGDNLDSLRRIARDDDRGGNLTSRVRFWARAGKTYQIAIDGYRGEEGQIKGRLRLTRPKRYRPRR